jgi:transglutaminase-like putative cysteine protease
MAFLTVRHLTVYRYREPVGLGEHRMMFRPRASHDLRLIRTSLAITPEPANLRWLHDPFDNSVAVASFVGTTRELRFESTVTIEHFESTVPEYPLEDHAKTYPFKYTDADFANLANGLHSYYPNGSVTNWAIQFLDAAEHTPTMKILRSMTRGIRDQFQYTRRVEKGVQTPDETIEKRAGSCRDFAILMMEAARSLGIAARFVSGYIFIPSDSDGTGGGATHAWMQAYLPGAGWIDFDPTNSIVGNRNLIRVGVAWTPDQVLPLSGTYDGSAEAFTGMDVNVTVTEDSESPAVIESVLTTL